MSNHIPELQRKQVELRTAADEVAAKAELSDEDVSKLADLRAQHEAVNKRIGELKFWDEQRGKAVAPAHAARPTADTQEAIFLRYVRTQDVGAKRELGQSKEEQRASNDTTMNITTAADGGDLVPTGHYQGIIERLRPQALYNLLGVRMIPGSGTTVNVPIDNEADNGAFVSTSESGEFDRDAPAVSKIAMTLVKYTKRLDLTYELMQDEDSRLMDFLNTYVAQGMAATMNSLLVAEALADGTAGLTLDSATAIGGGEIPELLYKLSSEYARGNVAWLMRRATEGYIRGLASSSNWLFAPNPTASGNGQSTGNLWGVPVYSDENVGQLAASGKSLLIGNWSYMGMRLDPSMTFLLDPYSRARYGETILHYYFRCDFEVLQAAAFQYATHPTG